jgi:hypothetical protein
MRERRRSLAPVSISDQGRTVLVEGTGGKTAGAPGFYCRVEDFVDPGKGSG